MHQPEGGDGVATTMTSALALVRRVWSRMPRWTPDVAAFLVIVALGYAYLYPASQDVFHPNPNRMIGDNTDLVGLSWQYQVIVRTFFHDPSRLLFGAIFTEDTNAPIGAALWIPWDERILVLLLAPFTRDETLPTVVTWALMSLTGLATYVFGRVLKWPRFVALGMGICFAYNNYTRSRASVHTGFTGLFGIVLAFTALELLSQREPPVAASGFDADEARQRRKRTSIWAAVALMLAMFSSHYYLVMLVVLAPFFLVYFVLRARSAGLPLWRSVGRLVACSLPAVAFLGWNFLMPVAPKYRTLSAAPEVRHENVEYLHAFGAHPIDYLGFDVKFGSKDWLKSRIEYTETIRAEIGGSNLHERSNGIRWSLLAVFFIATVSQLWPNRVRPDEVRSSQMRGLLILFAVVCFFLSLSPQGLKVYDTELGPSALIFKYLPQFRVPSRFGPFAEFGVIAVVGEFLVSLARRWTGFGQLAKWVVNPLLPIIAVVDYAPINPMMMAEFSYARKELVLPNGDCGMGMGVPFSHLGYWQYQQTRGTGCRLLFPSDSLPEHLMESRFSERLNYDTPDAQKSVVSFARCTGVDWVIFCGSVSRAARESMCSQLGWKFVSNDSCRSTGVEPTKRKPMECLP